MSGYNVVEKTVRETRFMRAAEHWVKDPCAARAFESREDAQSVADELNTKHAAEAYWCKYEVRPSPSTSTTVKTEKT